MIAAFPALNIKSETHRFISDLLTPVGVYQQIRTLADVSFLLESVQQNESIGRYSVIALMPLITFKSSGNDCEITIEGNTQSIKGNPFTILQELTNQIQYDQTHEDNRPMWVGYLGYDMIRSIENIPNNNPDSLDIPESFLVMPSAALTFDHICQMMSVTFFHISDSGKSSRTEEAVFECLKKSSPYRLLPTVDVPKTLFDGFKPNISQQEFEEVVRKTKKYIYAGDIFQGVLSQRFETEYEGDSFETYRALRRINPSPYLYHLHCKNFAIAGSSPEMLVRLDGDKITIRPIAGTIRRGQNAEEDNRLEKQLLSDEKELAEHMMLIDLARNDIGRVSVPGTVKPEKTMSIENYSHVKHIVSEITGKLDTRYSAIDLFKAVFPAGTLSGTPKIRAMEIIDELETVRRGVYGGSIIMWRLNDFFNSCIIIRSVLFKNKKAYIQAGSGIVADSVPENEFNETLKKASAVVNAIRQSRHMQSL